MYCIIRACYTYLLICMNLVATAETADVEPETDNKNKRTFSQGTTFRLLRRIKQDHKLLFWAFVISLFIGGALYIIEFVLMLDHHFTHFVSESTRASLRTVLPELEHIDFVGVTVGFAGILIAVVITLVVEEQKEIEDKNLSRAVAQLNAATVTTQNVATEILSKYTALELRTTLVERIESITNIVKLCARTNNHLYVLNYSANGGYLECHNASVIIDEGRKLENPDKPHERPSRLGNVKIYDFHKWYELLRDDRDRIKKEIKEFATEGGGSTRIHFAVLKTAAVSRTPGENKYERLLDRIFRQETIVAYDSQANQKMPMPKESIPMWDTFTMPSDSKFSSDEELRKDFISHLVKRNVREIKGLVEAKINIHQLNHIPFQFYASIPPDSDTSTNREQCCLIEFINIHAIGERAGVVAFESRNPDVIKSLKDVFDKVLNEQNTKTAPESLSVDPDTQKLYSLFDLGRTQFDFIIKSSDLNPPGEDTKAYNAKVDQTCAEELKDLLWTKLKNVDYPATISPQTARNEIDQALSSRSGINKTYFCIGVFGNELTDWLSEKTGYFKIETTQASKRMKHISMRTNDATEWVSLKKDPDDEAHDIGLLAKFVLSENIAVIVIGGMTGLGTKKLGEYIKTNWKQVCGTLESKGIDLSVNGDGFEFVMLFDVNDDLSQGVAVKSDYVYVKLTETVSKK